MKQPNAKDAGGGPLDDVYKNEEKYREALEELRLLMINQPEVNSTGVKEFIDKALGYE